MTTALTYTTYVEQIALMAVVPETTDVNFQAIIPSMISYAEDRIYRDLDFVFTSASRTDLALTAGNRTLTVPYTLADGSTWVVTEQMILSYPYLSGLRVAPLTPTTLEFINAVYGGGSQSPTGQPKFFTTFNDNEFIVAPVPDQNYAIELVGTYRPVSLSATSVGPTGVTGTTFLSMYLPELLIVASMIYISLYQRNFLGGASNSPEMPVTYENQYMALLKGAGTDEARKSFSSAGWSALSPTPLATPPRS